MPIIGDGGMWNDPSWSVSVEAWIYVLIFPIVALIAERKPSPFVIATFTTVGLALFGMLLTTLPAGDNFKAGWIAFGRGAFGFLGGWGAYQLYNSLKIPGYATDLLCVSLLGAMIAVQWAGVPSAAWLLLPFYPVFVLGLTNSDAFTAKLMSARPTVFLGEISYSVYLMHALVRYAVDPVFKLLDIKESVWAWLLIYIPVVIAVSTLTYIYFEKPARDRIRKLLGASSRPESRAAEASF
jgi:peptidoglycan/LPS O-acetylase OafA/YrhL